MKKIVFLFVAGLLEIILGFVCMFMSSMLTFHYVFIVSHLGHYGFLSELLFTAISGIVASILGLIGGISTIKKSRFIVSVIGVSFICLWGILFNWWTAISSDYYALEIFEPLTPGTLIIIFSIISLILLIESK